MWNKSARYAPRPGPHVLFQTQFAIQAQVSEDTGNEGSHRHQWSKGYALVLEVHLGVDQTRLTACFDSCVIKSWMVRNLLRQLDFVIHQLHGASAEERVSDIKVETPEDLQQIWEWNKTVPATIDRRVDEIILERIEAQPLLFAPVTVN